MKTAKDRFYEVMDSLSLNDYKVHTGIERITKNMMSKLRQGHTEEVSVKILIPFCEAYPQVNANYILTGKGGMFLDSESSATNSDTEPKFSTTSAMYETLIKDRDEQIEELKAEVNKLIGENNVMREQLGMKERKISSKSA